MQFYVISKCIPCFLHRLQLYGSITIWRFLCDLYLLHHVMEGRQPVKYDRLKNMMGERDDAANFDAITG